MGMPDFSDYRRPSTADPSRKNSETSDNRAAFSYLMTGGLAVGGAYSAGGIGDLK